MSPRKRARPSWTGHLSDQSGFTLVEMLIAVAITLVMMAAVVTLFANITDSVRNRRATLELSGQLRQVRNMLQQDLAGATCPGLTWQRFESNLGYIELVEGQYRDTFPSMLTDGNPDSDKNNNPDINLDLTKGEDELDPALSIIPRANDGTLVQKNDPADPNRVTSTVNGLGDYDDILMFTSRNEHEPFVGRVPDYNNGSTGFTTLESPLAEVIWFAMENPQQEERAAGFFGEPGMRTIYRRALLIAPWIDPIGAADPTNPASSHPGVVRLLDPTDFPRADVDRALAVLIAFQDRYDLSVRLEWDALALNGLGQWKIVTNTLADLTKRENRFGHYQYRPGADRRYPYSIVSAGTYTDNNEPVKFVVEPDVPPPMPGGGAAATANLLENPAAPGQYHVATYVVAASSYDPATGPKYFARPFAYVDNDTAPVDATANAMLNDDGQVVRVVQGPVPLWGQRRGEDVMLSNVLAFDLRVYDPGAPIYQETATTNTMLEPADPGWKLAYNIDMPNDTATIATSLSGGYAFVGQGAYVDMGYAFPSPLPLVASADPWITPWFAQARGVFDKGPTGNLLTPGYALYDTWSLSYENNGIDEDGVFESDQGTNGLDDNQFMGPDDVTERETAPPYDKPLRGIQTVIRVYERDSRQILQVRVDQHFLTE